MTDQTTVFIQEDGHGTVVATDDATGLQAEGSNRSLALTTLAQKLEAEVFEQCDR